MMNRRTFLNRASALTVTTVGGGVITGIASGLASNFYVSTARANGTSPVDKFLVVIDMPGGWDTTLSLDPWTASVRPSQDDLFLEYRDDQVTRVENLALGPAMISMVPFAKEMSIINGVFLNSSDNGHPASQLYVFSGDPMLKSPSMTVEFNAHGRCAPTV